MELYIDSYIKRNNKFYRKFFVNREEIIQAKDLSLFFKSILKKLNCIRVFNAHAQCINELKIKASKFNSLDF